MSDNSAYPLLAARLDTIGYKLRKVVYRGYNTSNTLQKMQETAISSRTNLRLEADTQRQEQLNATEALIAMEAQAKVKFEQEKMEAEHRAYLKQVAADQEINARKAEYTLKLKQEQDMNEVRCKQEQEMNAVRCKHGQDMNTIRKEFLTSLVQMQVDMTKYLVAEVSSKPTSHLLIENSGTGDKSVPNLHIH